MTPDLFGRADLEKHPTSVAVAQNFLLKVQGGMYSRPGMKFIALRKQQNKTVAFARFVFSPTDCCVVEFGEGYIRFLTADGYVQKNNAPYEILSPFTEEDFKYITYDQSGDVLYLAIKGKHPKTLTRYAATDWRLEDYEPKNGPFDTDNGDLAALTKVGGQWLITQLTGYQFSAQDVGSTFKLEKEFDAQSLSFTQSNSTTAQTLLSKVFLCCGTWRIDTTGTWTGTIKVQYSEDGTTWRDYRSYSATNTANVNSSGEISGRIRYLRIDATTWTSGTAYIQFRVESFTYNFFGKIASVNNASEAYATLSNIGTGAAAQIAGNVSYTSYTMPTMTSNTTPEGEAFYVEPGYTGKVLCEDGVESTVYSNAYKAFNGSSSTNADVPVYVFSAAPKLGYKFNTHKHITGITVTVSAPEEDLVMTAWVYSESAGWREAASVNIAGGSAATKTVSFGDVICDAIAVDFRAPDSIVQQPASRMVTVQDISPINITTVSYNANITGKFYAPSWGNRQGWPNAVGFFQGRLAWYKGYKAEMSKIDDFDNFEVSLKVKDDDAIQTIAKGGGMCDIRYAVSARRLILLADGGEHINTSDVITPSSSGIIQQSNYGTDYVRPLIVGSRVLFVQLSGSSLLDLQYDYASDNWQADDLCALAPHLFAGRKIVQLEYQASPQGIVWVLLDNGTVLTLSYSRQHEILAWTRQQTAGFVEAICVLPGTSENQVFFAVNRDGVRTVEMLASQLPNTVREDAVCVDSAVVQTSTTAQTIVTGLTHLNGKQVNILADGNVCAQQTVANGQITLTTAAKKVVVGLPMEYNLTTLPLVIPTQAGDFTGRLKPETCIITLSNSAAGNSGQLGQLADPLIYGTDDALFTGTVRTNISAVSEETPQLVLSGSDPLPFNVVKITTEYR